jgi:heme exporter protein C
MTAINWFHFASPARFYSLAGRIGLISGLLALILATAGLWVGFFVAPTDYQQGEVYRIIFIHVPAAWMAMFTYVVIAFWGMLSLSLNARLPAMMGHALAPTGAMFAFIALWTGAFWGRPTWGAYWVWDARLTSTLILLFLYLGLIALRSAIDDPRRADRACALLAIVGVINVPIIYFSVKWWNTLHQGATISMTAAPKMAQTMLTAMLLMTFAAWAYTIWAAMYRVRSIIVEREAHSEWLASELDSPGERRA